MAKVTGYTAARMKQIEDETVVGGFVDLNGELLLETRAGSQINAGSVKGDKGDEGLDGAPAGAILAWPAMGIPSNWVECNGQAISRSDYSDLFAIIGSTYGDGDGVSTFNVPDFRGRTLVGLDTSQTEFNSLSKIGGEKQTLLTIDQIPAHDHGLDNLWYVTGVGALQNGAYYGATTGARRTHMTGGGLPHNNLQPYGVTKYIIKASGGVGALNSTVESALLGRMATVESLTTNRIRAVFVDKTERLFTSTWSLGPATPTYVGFKPNSNIDLYVHWPHRNEIAGTEWGGVYIEPQVRFRQAGVWGSWMSLGSSGYTNMIRTSAAIMVFENTIRIVPNINAVFDLEVRWYARAYTDTAQLNKNHAIDTLSGTAAKMPGVSSDQHWFHAHITEIRAG